MNNENELKPHERDPLYYSLAGAIKRFEISETPEQTIERLYRMCHELQDELEGVSAELAEMKDIELKYLAVLDDRDNLETELDRIIRHRPTRFKKSGIVTPTRRQKKRRTKLNLKPVAPLQSYGRDPVGAASNLKLPVGNFNPNKTSLLKSSNTKRDWE